LKEVPEGYLYHWTGSPQSLRRQAVHHLSGRMFLKAEMYVSENRNVKLSSEMLSNKASLLQV